MVDEQRYVYVDGRAISLNERESFIDMVQEYYHMDRQSARNWVNRYEDKSLYDREQERKPIVDNWNRKQKYEEKGKIIEFQPPLGEKPSILPQKKEKDKRVIYPKFIEKSKYKTSKGNLNPIYVHTRAEKNKRFMPLGGKSEHYYDIKTDRELTRREYDTIRKSEGNYLEDGLLPEER